MELGERQLLDALAGLLGVLSCMVLVVLPRRGTTYGRYCSARFRWRVPARLAWVLQELPSLALPLLECAHGADHLRRPPNALLLAMFLIHYAHRTLIFPFLIRGGKPTPLQTFVLAVMFCTYNGYMQGRFLGRYADYTADWLTDPRFLAGGLFEYVTAANYFGEIVEWIGYAVATWSVQGASFALFTFCMLFCRAQQHHRWYLEKFEDYPKSRKILFPFLF
ncbi:3-oxo-5-alpha-steroid 4-dehydrogenase 1 [Rhynchocyon petersi]